jgi:hypothetical protein
MFSGLRRLNCLKSELGDDVNAEPIKKPKMGVFFSIDWDVHESWIVSNQKEGWAGTGLTTVL